MSRKTVIKINESIKYKQCAYLHYMIFILLFLFFLATLVVRAARVATTIY